MTSSRKAEPRWATPRNPERRSIGSEIAWVAEQLKQPFMPWQRMVAEVGGELVRDEETGFWVPAYSEVMITVPRQSGKTVETLAWEIHRINLWEPFDGKPQSVAYTAQTGMDARKKFRKDQIPMLRRSPFWRGIDKVRYSAEDMGAEFHNGGSISVLNNSEESGHGSIFDLGVEDEIFADVDYRRDQALTPAMATRHDSQKLVTSTAGDETAVVFNEKQSKGRAAVAKHTGEGMAYFEFSAAPEDDPEDPETWRRTMPALGYTITERTVRAALETMRKEDGDLSEFMRAWLNIPQRRGASVVIPAELWEANQNPSTELGAGLVFGIDSTPDQSSGSIVAVDAELHCELIEHRAGTGWMKDRAIELAGRWGAEVAVDASGPVGHLAASLEAADVNVHRYTPQLLGHACGFLLQQITEKHLAVRTHQGLNAAVAGATKTPMGDAWRWGRKSTDVDVSPLIALTLAVGRHTAVEPQKEMLAIWT